MAAPDKEIREVAVAVQRPPQIEAFPADRDDGLIQFAQFAGVEADLANGAGSKQYRART